MIKECLKLGIFSIKQRKFPSFIICLCIAIVTSTVISITSIGYSSKLTVLDNLSSELGLDLMSITQAETAKKGFFFAPEDFKMAEAQKNIEFYVPGFGFFYDVFSYQGLRNELLVLRTNENFAKLVNIHLKAGRFFSKKEVEKSSSVCILNLKAAEDYKKLSDTGSLEELIDKKLIWSYMKGYQRNDYPLTIIGIIDNAPRILEDRIIKEKAILIPVFLPEEKLSISYSMSNFYVKVKDLRFLDETKRRLEKAFLSVDKKIKAISEKERLKKYMEQINSLYKVGILYTLFTLIGATVSIVTVFLLSLIDRYEEIGVRRAVGATRKQIFIQFYIEFLILVVVGSIIGFLFSSVSLWIVYTFYLKGVRVVFSYYSYFICFVISVLFCSSLGLYPVFRAMRVSISDILK